MELYFFTFDSFYQDDTSDNPISRAIALKTEVEEFEEVEIHNQFKVVVVKNPRIDLFHLFIQDTGQYRMTSVSKETIIEKEKEIFTKYHFEYDAKLHKRQLNLRERKDWLPLLIKWR